MTATQATITADYEVGDRVQVQGQGKTILGRISSIHRKNTGVEYVVRTDAVDGGIGQVLNIWTTSGESSFLSPAMARGETR